jgi:hypothetical protein
MTSVDVFLLSVCYRLPKQTHLCCGSITIIYRTRDHEQYRDLLQCTVHYLVHYTYCVPKNSQQLYKWETNILSDDFILFVLLTDDWPVRPQTWAVVVFKICFYLWYSCLHCNSIIMYEMENIKFFSMSNINPYCQYRYDWNVHVLKDVQECVRCHWFTRNGVRICSLTLHYLLGCLVCRPVWIITLKMHFIFCYTRQCRRYTV